MCLSHRSALSRPIYSEEKLLQHNSVGQGFRIALSIITRDKKIKNDKGKNSGIRSENKASTILKSTEARDTYMIFDYITFC